MIHPRQTILLIEDEANAVLLIKQAFRKAEILNPLQVVDDGEKALAYLKGTKPYEDRQSYPMPGIILLDLKLPRMTGFEILKSIRTDPDLRHLLVIVLTTSKERRDIISAYQHGTNSYLVKPVSFYSLVEVVKGLKNYWLTLSEIP